LWFAFVIACLAGAAVTGTRTLTDSEAGTGESGRAEQRIADAGLEQPATESVLVRSADAATTANAAASLERRLERLREVRTVAGPRDTPALSTAGGRTLLVQVTLRGPPDDAKDRVAPVQKAVAATAASHPRATLREAGDGSIDKAFDDMLADDLARADMISVPLTLVLLVIAFGALVAASVPLLLGITSVAAALGVSAMLSQLVPSFEASSSLVVLIGLAVGVDYSLFYIRREREERRAGKGPHAALEASAATVGRAVVISGLTVMVALAGLLVTGLGVFTSMAVATIAVVAISVLGSITVLPATLALLGDRIDKGRIPLVWRLRRRQRATGRAGLWASLARAVTNRPTVALVTALCVLGALALPALTMKTANSGINAFPAGAPVRVAQEEIEQAFPGAPSDARIVVTAEDLDSPAAMQRLTALGERARTVTGGRGAIGVDVARDGRTAVVSVPMPDDDMDAAKTTVAALRHDVTPTVSRVAPGAHALVGGEAAANADFTDRLNTSTPLVIAFVLGLAMVLLVAAFRSPALAATVVGLNLLSVGAAYGVLVAVFQHDWAESLLDFTSTGTVTDWLPLFAFVILFGLSMDYTILVLERIREARRAGRSARDAAAEGVAATGGTVTSAALVMVAVFSIFATMQFADNKQLGVGLAAAILLDATIVRGIALPAAVTLLGERRWRVRPARRAARGWDDVRGTPLAAQTGSDAR
jgi:RND superfamily putative drug exporter